VTANPNGLWVTQQARNFLLMLGERGRRLRFVLRDRDAKFSCSFDDGFCAEGAEMLVTPVQAPNANAYAERWIRTVRAESTDAISSVVSCMSTDKLHERTYAPYAVPGTLRAAEVLEIRDGRIVRGELFYDAEELRKAMAQRPAG
jgi:hypothetical protein